jgi:hypothetical protein
MGRFIAISGMAAKRLFGACFLVPIVSAKNAERMGHPLLFAI